MVGAAAPRLEGNSVLVKSAEFPQLCSFEKPSGGKGETAAADVALVWRCVKVFAENGGVLYGVHAGLAEKGIPAEGFFTDEPLCLLLEGKRYNLRRLSSAEEGEIRLPEKGAGYLATLEFLDRCAEARTIEYRLDTIRGVLHGGMSEDTVRSFHAFPTEIRKINLGVEVRDQDGKFLRRKVEEQPNAEPMIAVFQMLSEEEANKALQEAPQAGGRP
jgi:hypothetical protein